MSNLKMTILVVDDDPELLETVSEFFKDDFANVISAIDGISAYIAIKDEQPDIIFSDKLFAVEID